MFIIAVIGAGQLGSRHLQALARLKSRANIEVVDSCVSSLKRAQARFEEMPNNPNIFGVRYCQSLNDLSYRLDLVIIATNSDVRATVIASLLLTHHVANLVLEKVLFQRIEDYLNISRLLSQKKLNVWVNHARRVYPYYRGLKALVNESGPVACVVTGGGWGLASNGLHFIDLLAYLTGCNALAVNATGLRSGVWPGKRLGYLEVIGKLTGSLGDNNFELICEPEVKPLIIEIRTDMLRVVIDEGSECVCTAALDTNWTWSKRSEKIVYAQSELTGILAEEILLTNACNLPTFEEAITLHTPFIEALLKHFSSQSDVPQTACPIT
jgi:hypothetical protein